MIGTLLNVAAILLGGGLGLWFGARLPERVRQICFAALGLFTAGIGIQMFLKSQQSLAVLASLLIGGGLGEWWRIEDRLRSLGVWLEKRFSRQPARKPDPSCEAAGEGFENEAAIDVHPTRFVRGFLTASLLFCIGPIAILGSIQDGLSGDYNLLAVKAVMDGFASAAFASTLGVGVLFSSLVILVYQGGLTLLARQAQALVTPVMMTEMTATGGILLLGVAISNLLEIKRIRVGNLVPAILIAPLIMAILTRFGIK